MVEEVRGEGGGRVVWWEEKRGGFRMLVFVMLDASLVADVEGRYLAASQSKSAFKVPRDSLFGCVKLVDRAEKGFWLGLRG